MVEYVSNFINTVYMYAASRFDIKASNNGYLWRQFIQTAEVRDGKERKCNSFMRELNAITSVNDLPKLFKVPVFVVELSVDDFKNDEEYKRIFNVLNCSDTNLTEEEKIIVTDILRKGNNNIEQADIRKFLDISKSCANRHRY